MINYRAVVVSHTWAGTSDVVTEFHTKSLLEYSRWLVSAVAYYEGALKFAGHEGSHIQAYTIETGKGYDVGISKNEDKSVDVHELYT